MPYFYLYDSYLQDRSYASTLIKLETTLTDLGIQGRVSRLTLLKSVKDIIESAIKDGADTIVAVGNDITLSQVAQAVAKYPKTTMGFIPLGQDYQSIAPILGIPQGILACHVLSGRLVEEMGMGKVNNQYFLQSIVLQGQPILECERSFELALEQPHNIKICNLDSSSDSTVFWPQKGELIANIEPQPKNKFKLFSSSPAGASTIPIKEMRVLSADEELPILIDQYRTIKTPATITAAPQRLRIIVGKKRLI